MQLLYGDYLQLPEIATVPLEVQKLFDQYVDNVSYLSNMWLPADRYTNAVHLSFYMVVGNDTQLASQPYPHWIQFPCAGFRMSRVIDDTWPKEHLDSVFAYEMERTTNILG